MKVVDTKTLKRMTQRARVLGYNRTLHLGVEKTLDPNGKHVLSHEFIHGDVQCLRCGCVLLKLRGYDKPVNCVLDLSIDDWNRIPEYKEESSSAV